MDAPQPLADGIADRYRLEREIGRGGMATVYLARDLRHDAPVALKVMRPELSTLFAGDRFQREIRITAQLQHPHILPVLDSGEAGGYPYYTMPFVDGESLGQRIAREGPLPIADALRVTAQVCDALVYAHGRGVIHRDIKPENVLLAHGHALLADFGIARALDVAGSEVITSSGVSLGTALYMSPEQAVGEKVDGRSDVYALACVLYEMLSGSPPFAGSSRQAILARHAVDPVPSLRTVRVTVSPAVEEALTRAMAKVPADRFPDAAAFRDALAVATTEQATGTWRAARRRRSRWPLAAGIAAAGLLGAAALGWRALRADAPLDDRRVTVFPLVVSGALPATTGEDLATVIGSALDGAGGLRWVDGWRALDPRHRADARALGAADARALARAGGARYYLTGRAVARGDSADVLLELVDVAADAVVARGRAAGLASEPWRTGLRAVNGVLPTLLPGAGREVVAEWTDRAPGAIAHFLLGEAAFRRLRTDDALAHFGAAVAADSAFALAAVRGAQAASWGHHPREAGALVRAALARPLAPKYAHFARGFGAYLEGRLDSAATELRRALAVDPSMAAAWLTLGEAHTHLLPVGGRTDTLAESAFAAALRLDSGAVPALFHPIERRLREGRLDEASPMLRRLAAAVDSGDARLAQLRLMESCVQGGRTDWRGAAARDAVTVLAAARALAVGGHALPCAAAGYQGVLDGATVASDVNENARATALFGLVGVEIARGRDAAAAAAIDASVARGEGGSSLFMLAAPLAPALAPRAAQVAAADAERFGADFARCPFAERSWVLALYHASIGRGDASEAIARRLAGADTGWAARASGAHARLARHDTAGAMAALAALLARPAPGGSALSWNPGEPHGAERLAYARLLLARGEARRAIDVADVFDAPEPASYALYLRASLELRARAAESINDAHAKAYRARLARLGGAPRAALGSSRGIPTSKEPT